MLQIGGYNVILTRLGYPHYMLSILGIWKILGVAVILLPKLPLVKEWAYAGFFFVISGTAISNLAMKEPFVEVVPSLILLTTIIYQGIQTSQQKNFKLNKQVH